MVGVISAFLIYLALRVCYSSCGSRDDLMGTAHEAFHFHFRYNVHDAQAPRIVRAPVTNLRDVYS